MVSPCATCKTNLVVHVEYTPMVEPIAGADVTITGPTTLTRKTDETGTAYFMDIPPGTYDVKAVYNTNDPVANAAHAEIGSTQWAFAAYEHPYKWDSNKCNLFVYDMLTAGGKSVPTTARYGGVLWRPPFAKDWASADPVGSFTKVTPPRPGDVVAKAYPGQATYTGHTGIVGYPEQVDTVSANVPANTTVEKTIQLHRRTVSAGNNEVLYNDFGFRDGKATFKRDGG